MYGCLKTARVLVNSSSYFQLRWPSGRERGRGPLLYTTDLNEVVRGAKPVPLRNPLLGLWTKYKWNTTKTASRIFNNFYGFHMERPLNEIIIKYLCRPIGIMSASGWDTAMPKINVEKIKLNFIGWWNICNYDEAISITLFLKALWGRVLLF